MFGDGNKKGIGRFNGCETWSFKACRLSRELQDYELLFRLRARTRFNGNRVVSLSFTRP